MKHLAKANESAVELIREVLEAIRTREGDTWSWCEVFGTAALCLHSMFDAIVEDYEKDQDNGST